jgi:hypothetical protein
VSTGHGCSSPVFAGVGFGGGSAPAVVDVCVATHMRGLVPHDRVCEIEERCRSLASSMAADKGLLRAFSRVAPRVVFAGALSSPSRLLVAATRSSRVPSSVRRARARARRSSAACLAPRFRRSHASCARVPRGRLVHRPVTQKQFREPMPGPHQITASVLTRPDQITRGLLFRPGHPHRGDLTQPKQPRQPLGVPPVGLDPVGRRPDPRRRRDNTADPRLGTPARKPVPRRSGLVHTRTGAGSVFSHPTVASHPGGTLSDRTSPLPISITPATTDRACTSNPTQLPSLMTGASRNCGSTAGPIPTATRA